MLPLSFLCVISLLAFACAVTGPLVYLTVSSLPAEEHRLVEINWIPDDEAMLDAKLHLYGVDPSTSCSNGSHAPLLTVQPGSRGFFRTRFRFPKVLFTEANLTDSCLFFWVTLVSETSGELRATNCLRARPRWMRANSDALANFSLVELMLPGTHNSASYTAHPQDSSPIGRYLYTQEEDVWTQLVFGIRHLDLRVAYRKRGRSQGDDEEEFWITHSAFRTDVTVRDVARQVRRFLLATQEIVVMDFHRFVAGFRDKRSARARHRELVSLLEEELGDFMIPAHFTSSASLRSIWESGRRLYVGYANDGSRSRLSARLFPPVRHLWADSDELVDLKAFLNRTLCDGKGGGRLTSAMAQLTPTASGVLFNAYGGLRVMTDQVNRRIGEWFGDGDWNACANIVATDFFLGNNMVELAVATNLKRATELRNATARFNPGMLF